MTLAGAIDTARHMAPKFGKDFVIFRMPGFTPNTYAILPGDRGLPPNAEIVETFHRDGTSTRVRRDELKPAGEAVKREPAAPRPPAPSEPQGSLF